MKSSLILILFVIMQLYHLVKPDTTTLRVDERVRILKDQLRSRLRHKHHTPEKETQPAYYDEPDDTAPIKPIEEEETFRGAYEHNLKKLKTSTTSDIIQTPQSRAVTRRIPRNFAKPLTPITQLKQRPASFSLDVFYRKSFDLNMELDWVHCWELATPYVKGAKQTNKWPTKLGVKDPIIVRFLQLLNSNTTGLSRGEKRSIMFQISKLTLRMFTWDSSAMYTVLSRISKRQLTTFASLKYGVKALFASWNIDLSNTTALLLNARIFRPPCFPYNNQGSSKFVRGSTIPTFPSSPNSRELACVRKGFDDTC